MVGDAKLLEEVKGYNELLTVNELNKTLVDLCNPDEVINLGKSDGGCDIFSAKLGEGKKTALIFGFPHPNEPIGSLTCLTLIKLIKNNKDLMKRYTWYIVPCADPDGASLNEGWFKGKFNIKKYAYNFYRTQAKKQTDWTFPAKYKDYSFDSPPKNTQALANLIKKIRPDLVYPLHNAGFSGAYFFVTKRLGEKYYSEMINLCNRLKIPLDLGEPEMPFMKILKKPIYLDFGLEELYDYFKGNGQNPLEILNHGTHSIGYARKYNKNVFGLIGEVPYIYDAKIEDMALSGETRKTMLKRKYEEYSVIVDLIEDALKLQNVNKESLFYSLLKEIIPMEKSLILAGLNGLKSKEYLKKASNAEKFNSDVIGKFYTSLVLGECRRLLLDSKKSPETKKYLNMVEAKIDELIEYVDKNSSYNVIPIDVLVKLQIGCLLISINHLK